MIGAPALTALAALRSGVGLVKIAAPENVVPFALTIEPSATGLLMSQEIPQAMASLDEADPSNRAVLAVGPGMGRDPLVADLVLGCLKSNRSVVLDADGLNHLAESGQAMADRTSPLVMTPHPGEFRRLAKPRDIDADPTDPATRTVAAVQLARADGAIAVLKGHRSVVTDGERVYVNQTGNTVLATAGSGDVLTGLIAALMAQGMDGFQASVLGVFLHGRAGDLWQNRHGASGLTARDLANLLPDAFDEARAVDRKK